MDNEKDKQKLLYNFKFLCSKLWIGLCVILMVGIVAYTILFLVMLVM